VPGTNFWLLIIGRASYPSSDATKKEKEIFEASPTVGGPVEVKRFPFLSAVGTFNCPHYLLLVQLCTNPAPKLRIVELNFF
jgi:hypothetical protein